MIAWRMRAHGRVQGVWYRATTQRVAAEMGLFGWVRNMPDGSVEVHAEGDEATLDRLYRWLHEGPPLAHVTHVDKDEATVEGFTKFFVKY